MISRPMVIIAVFFILATAGGTLAESRGGKPGDNTVSGQVESSGGKKHIEPIGKSKTVGFRKDGNRVLIPGIVSVGLENWETVYIPIDVETNWFKSTRSTRKPVLVQMTAIPSTYLPFSNNVEFIALMENAYTRRDFIYGLEKANGREVVEIKKVNYHGRDYIGTRFQSNPAGKIIFSLCSVAKNGLMVAFKFCFDRADFRVVADNNGESIIDTFLANVIFI